MGQRFQAGSWRRAQHWIPQPLRRERRTSPTVSAWHERSSWGGWVWRVARRGIWGPGLTADREWHRNGLEIPRRGEGATLSWHEAVEGHGRVRSARARERSIDGAEGLWPWRGCWDPCCPSGSEGDAREGFDGWKGTGCVCRHHRHCSTDSSNARPSRGTEAWFGRGRRDRVSGGQTAESVV